MSKVCNVFEAMDKARKNSYIIKQIFNHNKLTRPQHETRENIVKVLNTIRNLKMSTPQVTKILDVSAAQEENIMVVLPNYESANWWTLKVHQGRNAVGTLSER